MMTSSIAAVERDARLVNARHHGVNPGEIAIGVIIGRTSEFFDFFVYAIASVIVCCTAFGAITTVPAFFPAATFFASM